MISHLEKVIADYITAQVAAVEGDPLKLEVRPAMDGEPDPQNSAILVVKLNAECEVGHLWKGPLQLILHHPSTVKDLTIAHMKRCEAFLVDTFMNADRTTAAANKAAFKTAIEDNAPGWLFGGCVPNGWRDGNEGTAFAPQFVIDPLAVSQVLT